MTNYYRQEIEERLKHSWKKINSINGSAQQISQSTIDISLVEDIESVSNISAAFEYIFHSLNSIEEIINIIQFILIYKNNKSNILKIKKYYEFLGEKDEINELLSCFNCTWKNIRAIKKSDKFLIEFTKANEISNGERDILCFIAKLFESRSIMRKEKCILIIDEIFDYLDDANLISAQYFLTKFISQFKEAGKELFPIILTHLDPMYFNTYSFSSKNVVYLNKETSTSNKYKINNLLKDRVNCKKRDADLYNRISSNYLHYNTNDINEADYLSQLGVEECIYSPIMFRQKAFEELQNYVNGEGYDLALVCCGLRLRVEKDAYEQLSEDAKNIFLNTFKTVDKLAYAKEMGANVPEIHFLLSIIYNEAMHLDAQCQKLKPILCKLKNKVIHNMITEVIS